MKDDKGLYYFPFPLNRRVRMYVRHAEGTLFFRMWNEDVPEVWDEHGWVPYYAIEQAMDMYSGGDFDPKRAYDPDVAQELIREEALEAARRPSSETSTFQ
ncbi:hypothetical protein ACFL0Q_09680 [Thermodesulfobacteriota bacterium]